MPDQDSPLSQLDAAIAVQESLRGQVPDAIIDAALQALQAQRQNIA